MENQFNERSALFHHNQNIRPPSYGSLYPNYQSVIGQSNRTEVVQEILQHDNDEMSVQQVPQTVIVVSNSSPGLTCPECGAKGTLYVIPTVSIWQHYWALLLLILL